MTLKNGQQNELENVEPIVRYSPQSNIQQQSDKLLLVCVYLIIKNIRK